MRVKIISDGTVTGTKVVDAKTGETVEGVDRVRFVADAAHDSIQAVIHVVNPEIEAAVDVEEVEGGLTTPSEK